MDAVVWLQWWNWTFPHFVSSLFTNQPVLKKEGKKKEKAVFFYIICPPSSLSCLQSVSTSVPPLYSKIELQSPGERMLKWRHVISVPYQWLTEARVPRPVTSLSLSLAAPVGSTMSHHLGVVNASLRNPYLTPRRVSQEGAPPKYLSLSSCHCASSLRHKA